MLRVTAITLAGLMLVLGCRTNMKPWEEGSADAPRKVLIAGEETVFKRQVVAKVIAALGTSGWYFRIIALDQLATQRSDEYGAILLLAGYRAGRIDERVRSYLEGDPANPKVILLYTRGTEDPMPARSRPNLQVDSLSSASRSDRAAPRAEELAALIAKRLWPGGGAASSPSRRPLPSCGALRRLDVPAKSPPATPVRCPPAT